MIRRKPWWLSWCVPSYAWVTIHPHIYAAEVFFEPLNTNWSALVAHESVHLERQQAVGRWTWLWRYFTSRPFRLHEEALGIAAEIRATPSPLQQRSILESYVESLSSRAYWWAAESPAAARVAILDAVDRVG